MKWKINSFGGILLDTGFSRIAVNGGGTPAELEAAYLEDGKAPSALIVTCEHLHRSRSVGGFCLKHGVPLITSKLCGERLPLAGVKTRFLAVPGSRLSLTLGCAFSLHPVRYDSADPFGLTILDGGTLVGIVPDGRIPPREAEFFADCDVVILGNRLNIPAGAPEALERRLKSVCNTQAELDAIFEGFSGELICI